MIYPSMLAGLVRAADRINRYTVTLCNMSKSPSCYSFFVELKRSSNHAVILERYKFKQSVFLRQIELAMDAWI